MNLLKSNSKDIYLTDEQYKSILLKIKETVEQEGFQYSCIDSTTIGDKYTRSNCGMCNDNFTEKEMALFPDQFPGRKSMKYRQKHHKCPFDMRVESEHFDTGCFYHCCLFQDERRIGRKPNIVEIRELVDKTIQEVMIVENVT